MSDNVAITPGSGATIAADEVADGTLGTVKVQYTKLMDGTLDGTAKAVVKTTAPASSDGGLVVRGLLFDSAGNALVAKAASTAPVATDIALVVAISPNTPALPITDNAGSLTVDAPVGTPVFVRLSNGSAAVDSPPPVPTFKGRVSTFRIPGRAGTTGQKLFSLHNATGSTVVVRVTMVAVDHTQTVITAVTVLPPVVRLWKVTVLPTNGSAMTKVAMDSSLTSNASVTVLQDASADGTGSGTTLTATLPAGAIVTQEFASRLITAVGQEPLDRVEFLNDGEIITLRALEGIVVFLDYVLATQNAVTDMWIGTVAWTESAT